MARGAERVEDQEDAADDDGGVGDIEVGPVVVNDVNLEEVGDHAEAEAVPDIADGAAEDQRQGHHGGGEAAAIADDDEDDDRCGNQREDGQNPVRERGARRVSKHGEGRAGIEHVSDAEDAADDDDRVAFGDVADDPELGEAVEEEDEGGEGEEKWTAILHFASSPEKPIWVRASAQRPQTLGQGPNWRTAWGELSA